MCTVGTYDRTYNGGVKYIGLLPLLPGGLTLTTLCAAAETFDANRALVKTMSTPGNTIHFFG